MGRKGRGRGVAGLGSQEGNEGRGWGGTEAGKYGGQGVWRWEAGWRVGRGWE